MIGAFAAQVQRKMEIAASLLDVTARQQDLTEVGEQRAIAIIELDRPAKPVHSLLDGAEPVMNPAEGVEVRRILRFNLDGKIDQIERFFEPDITIRPQVTEVVGGVGVARIGLEELEERILGLFESIKTFERGGPGKEDVAVVGETFTGGKSFTLGVRPSLGRLEHLQPHQDRIRIVTVEERTEPLPCSRV